jgi:hypothetical protein
MKLCINCQHFRDGHYSKTYITPRCQVRGDDDAAYMREHVCGLDGKLYEPVADLPDRAQGERTVDAE